MGILENMGLAEYPRSMEPCQNITFYHKGNKTNAGNQVSK